MNSIKAFLKAKGLYLVCLALVFAATITGIAAIRSVVRGVEDLTRIQKQALEEGTDVWDSPDAAVNQPAQDVPVATAQPSPAPSAAGSASSSLYLCRFAVRAPQKYTQLFSPSSISDFGTNFPRSLPEPTPGSETSNVSLCLTLLVVTESLPSVHRLRR